MTDSSIIIEGRRIAKRYPGTVALDAVDFRVYRNQVNVLIGENGAGKSTLMRILAGVEKPDEGELLLDGAHVAFDSPRAAARQGIAIVHQELSVLPNLNLTENVFAGRELVRSGVFVDWPRQVERAEKALRHLGKRTAVTTLAGDLSLGSRQIVEVARTLDQQAKILILDEPTSALSNVEAEALFKVIAELKRSGVTIVYISHRLHELLHLGDFFTVLRSGRVVGEVPRSEVTRQWIVQRMSGRDVVDSPLSSRDAVSSQPLLQVKGLALAAGGGTSGEQTPLRDIGFSLNKGEILGIYGLLGAGRTELLEAIAGMRRTLAGQIELGGRHLRVRSVGDAIGAGIHLVPEDRQRDGLVAELSVRENMALASGKGFFLHRGEESNQARKLVKDLNIRTADLEVPITALSGGNQQKVLIARCLMRSPTVLLLDEPTRGVDVGAKAEIHDILRRLAGQGVGVIFASSEIEETQALADRALVMCQGRIAATFDREELTDEGLFAAASPQVATSIPATSGGASR
jgi:erythritol transport system ATP-binding protein